MILMKNAQSPDFTQMTIRIKKIVCTCQQQHKCQSGQEVVQKVVESKLNTPAFESSFMTFQFWGCEKVTEIPEPLFLGYEKAAVAAAQQIMLMECLPWSRHALQSFTYFNSVIPYNKLERYTLSLHFTDDEIEP